MGQERKGSDEAEKTSFWIVKHGVHYTKFQMTGQRKKQSFSFNSLPSSVSLTYLKLHFNTECQKSNDF